MPRPSLPRPSDGALSLASASSFHSGVFGRTHSEWQDFNRTETLRAIHLPLRPRKRIASHAHPSLHEHWIELLNDLILVAFLSNLGHVLLGGGPTIQNFLLIFTILSTVLQSASFVSLAANIWVIDDFFTLTLLLGCTTGTFLMANAIQLNAHLPCYEYWPSVDNGARMRHFFLGASVSTVGQICLFIRSGTRLMDTAVHVLRFLALLAALLTLDTYVPPWVVLLAFLLLTVVASYRAMNCPEQVWLVNASHMFSRLGVLTLVSLGEWIIQTVCHWLPSQELGFSCVQLFLCFCIALQYYNTRPREITECVLMERPRRATVIILAHFLLAFSLFLVGSSIDLEIHKINMESKHAAHDDHFGLDREHHHAGQDIHRRLSDCDKKCANGNVIDTWNQPFLDLGSKALACVQVLLICVRFFWKQILLNEQGMLSEKPGLKFCVRLIFGLCHALVPHVVPEKTWPGLTSFETILFAHCLLICPQLIFDSLFRTRHLRETITDVRSRVSSRIICGTPSRATSSHTFTQAQSSSAVALAVPETSPNGKSEEDHTHSVDVELTGV